MMIWTNERPSKPGLYWYRDQHDSLPDKYEPMKIFWSDEAHAWSRQTHNNGAVCIESYNGEWYGPVAQQANLSKPWNLADHNARILVRLKHGGSFYIEKTIPDEVALLLSEKLKVLRENGSSIPPSLRTKISDVVNELIKFAGEAQKQS
jgi:hypothetical protein